MRCPRRRRSHHQNETALSPPGTLLRPFRLAESPSARDINACLTGGFVVALLLAAGMKVVAEGIETQTQTRAVAAIGCQGVQGLHFARPMDAATLATWLDQWPS